MLNPQVKPSWLSGVKLTKGGRSFTGNWHSHHGHVAVRECVPRDMSMTHSHAADRGSPCPAPTLSKVTHSTEHTVLSAGAELPRVCPGPRCTCKRNKGRTQRQASISTGLERTRRCTGKVQDHSNAAGTEVLCKKPWMRPSDPTQVPWDVPLTWSPSLGEMMAWGPPRPPGSARVAVGGGRGVAARNRLPSPSSPGWLQASCSCCRFAGLPPSQAAVVYVIAGRFTFYHLIK